MSLGGYIRWGYTREFTVLKIQNHNSHPAFVHNFVLTGKFPLHFDFAISAILEAQLFALVNFASHHLFAVFQALHRFMEDVVGVAGLLTGMTAVHPQVTRLTTPSLRRFIEEFIRRLYLLKNNENYIAYYQ